MESDGSDELVYPITLAWDFNTVYGPNTHFTCRSSPATSLDATQRYDETKKLRVGKHIVRFDTVRGIILFLRRTENSG